MLTHKFRTARVWLAAVAAVALTGFALATAPAKAREDGCKVERRVDVEGLLDFGFPGTKSGIGGTTKEA